MRKPAPARFPDLCPGSGIHLPVTWEDAKDRSIERACPACGRLLGMRVCVGGASSKRLDVPASAKVPEHNRRREGAPP